MPTGYTCFIEDGDITTGRNMKQVKSKWSKIVHNFLDSGLEVIKLHETIRPENAVISLKHYLDGKGFPITYAKRENYIYMYRTDCTTVSIDEAIEGTYMKDNDGLKSTLYMDREQIRKRIKEMQT